VYFGSDRSGRYEIWRTHLEGGAPERITDQGGMVALESPDASTVYYTKSASEGPLFERRVDVGIEKKVLNSVVGRGFAVFDDGIYYLHRIAPLKSEIRFYRFAGGDRGVVSPIPFEFGLGLGVSPDRKTFLFTTIVPPENDLMLVDNFR
jgi:hypothetical protein